VARIEVIAATKGCGPQYGDVWWKAVIFRDGKFYYCESEKILDGGKVLHAWDKEEIVTPKEAIRLAKSLCFTKWGREQVTRKVNALRSSKS